MSKITIGVLIIFGLVVGFTLGRWSVPASPESDDQDSDATTTDSPPPVKRSFFSRLPYTKTVSAARPDEDHFDQVIESSHKKHHSDPTVMDLLGSSMSSNSVAKWQTKAMSERSNFFANVKLTPEQQNNFDGLLGAMNDALKDRAAFWAEEVRAGRISKSEMSLRMTTDMSGTLVGAYDAMDHAMPPDWRAKAGGNFSVMRFVDPSVHAAFQGLRPPTGSKKPPKTPRTK